MSDTRKDMRQPHNGHKWNDYVNWYWSWWSCSEPKWWRHVFKHKKRRAELRRAMNSAKDDADGTVFPLDKKPWRYFW